jgi:fructoselysine-6-P-deglycase FrlB-like protein
VKSQRAVTHTQAYCGGVATALALWSEASGDEDLRRAVAAAPGIVGQQLQQADEWADAQLAELQRPLAAVAFGTGPGWAAALEAALLLKEVAGVPAEGVETREGATSTMYALAPGHLVVSIGSGDDRLLDEAERVCASTGATVVRIPVVGSNDPRLTPMTSFPAALALAMRLGTNAGLDVDTPSWVTAYASTSRAPSDGAT